MQQLQHIIQFVAGQILHVCFAFPSISCLLLEFGFYQPGVVAYSGRDISTYSFERPNWGRKAGQEFMVANLGQAKSETRPDPDAGKSFVFSSSDKKETSRHEEPHRTVEEWTNLLDLQRGGKSCSTSNLNQPHEREVFSRRSLPPCDLGLDESEEISPDGSVVKRRLMKSRLKKIITKRMQRHFPDGRVNEYFVTEEMPEVEYSDEASMLSSLEVAWGASPSPFPSPLSPRSLTSSLDSLPLCGIYTDLEEGEPEVSVNVRVEYDELPDGKFLERKFVRTHKQRKIIKRLVMQGPMQDRSETSFVSSVSVSGLPPNVVSTTKDDRCSATGKQHAHS